MNSRNMQIGVSLFALFMLSVFVTIPLAVHLPYIANWPYTGLLYGTGFAVLALVILRRVKMPTVADLRKADSKLVDLAKVGCLYALCMSAFFSFTVRFPTEAERSYAFEEGTIVEKYKSSNHGYLSFRIESPESGKIELEGYPQDLWDRLAVGDKVSKRFGSPDLVPLK